MPAKYLISVIGPTSLGKTPLALVLAQHFGTEIVSSDSRQFYREMSIGTAVPSEEELKTVPHHFIQHISIFDTYSVGQFEQDALSCLRRLHSLTDVAVMAGGSGLYVNAVTHGLDDFPQVDQSIRKGLRQRYDAEGLEPLQELLRSRDPVYYEEVDLQNPHRIMRALEISIGTGKPYSSFRVKQHKDRPFQTISIGLNAERATLYERINNRVDQMVASGLLEEASTLYPHRHLNALQTVGYKELFDYLEGKWDLETAVAEIKKNTRRFAKRQLTWFGKDRDIRWFDYRESPQKIIEAIESIIHGK